MNLGFTNNESLLIRGSVINTVQDVEERTCCILDVNDIDAYL